MAEGSRGPRESGRRPPWLRAWLVVGLAAWATLGVLFVGRANNQGLVEDISFSPYHLVGYAALLVLAIYVAWTFFRALRHGRGRQAFPPLYGGLGLGLLLFLAWVVLDPIWRETLGIGFGIENGLAPPRLLIPAGLVLLAAGPLREAIAHRREADVGPLGHPRQWAGVAAVGIIGTAVTIVAFNPVALALNDWRVQSGTDMAEIWTMAPDGSAQTRILPAHGDGTDHSLPAWSPDGTRIAYTTWTNEGGVRQNMRNEDQSAAIWTMAVDGSDRKLLVDGAPDHAWIPAWSPDGRWIAYTVTLYGQRPAADVRPEANAPPGQLGAPGAPANSSIWLIRPDGTGARQITQNGVDAVGGAWSPDGTLFAFVVGDGATSDIRVASIDAEGNLSNEFTVAHADANDWGPAWEPDGERILFNSDRSGNDEVWIAPLGGSLADVDTVQLTDDPAGDWVPAVSREGKVAFVSDRSGDVDVWLMGDGGAQPTNLTRRAFSDEGTWAVSWAPDGSRLAYAVAPWQPPSSSGWVREDLAAAQSLLFGAVLSVLALAIVALGAPMGAFTLVLVLVVAGAALLSDEWRFLAGALVAGVLVDLLVRSVRVRWRARVAAAALPAAAILAIGLVIGLGGTLVWSLTLLLGVALASAAIGWGIAELADRLLPRPAAPEVSPAG